LAGCSIVQDTRPNTTNAIKEAIANKQKQLPSVPEERVYEVSHQIQQTLMQVVDLGDRFC
jgi:hypothetical protein